MLQAINAAAPLADVRPHRCRARSAAEGRHQIQPTCDQQAARPGPVPGVYRLAADSMAAIRPPALASSLVAFGAVAVLAASAAGPCHASELFQKTCAGAAAPLALTDRRSCAPRSSRRTHEIINQAGRAAHSRDAQFLGRHTAPLAHCAAAHHHARCRVQSLMRLTDVASERRLSRGRWERGAGRRESQHGRPPEERHAGPGRAVQPDLQGQGQDARLRQRLRSQGVPPCAPAFHPSCLLTPGQNQCHRAQARIYAGGEMEVQRSNGWRELFGIIASPAHSVSLPHLPNGQSWQHGMCSFMCGSNTDGLSIRRAGAVHLCSEAQ